MKHILTSAKSADLSEIKVKREEEIQMLLPISLLKVRKSDPNILGI